MQAYLVTGDGGEEESIENLIFKNPKKGILFRRVKIGARMKCGWLLWRPPVLQHSGDNNSATNNHLANSDFCWRRHWSVISGDSLQLYNAQVLHFSQLQFNFCNLAHRMDN
jgi:hypothetical protein